MSAPPAIHRLTANAADDLALDDYRAIYDELRERMSLRDLVDLLHSAYSIAWWSKWEAGDLRLTRAARNELRRAVGLPVLPPAVAELLGDPRVVSPDAAVYLIAPPEVGGPGGPSTPSTRVLLIGPEPHALDIRVNESVSARENGSASGFGAPLQSHVTEVTRTPRRAARKSIHMGLETWNRLNTARREIGCTWPEFLAELLDHWSRP